MSTDLNASHDPAKHAIDLRLDAIDRALLGWLPRHERIEIVGQIETKLRESAGASTAGGVLDDIARDRADRHEERLDSAGDRSAIYLRERPFLARRKPRSRLALTSGILGIIALTALAALPVTYVVVSTIIDDTTLQVSLLGGHLATVLLGGLLAVALGIAALVLLSRRGGRLVGHGWAITGLCTGPLPLFAGGLMALVVGSQLWGSGSVTPAYSTAPVASRPGGYPVNPYSQQVPTPFDGYPIGGNPAPPMPGSPYDSPHSYATPSSPHASPEQPPVPAPAADAPAPPPSTSPAPAVDADVPSAATVR
ncbi:MAG TPA: hypothetical protein VF278_18775 [Pirellulales bacterium]